MKKAFGPVPSRRLGRSIGINNIPPKVCTYSCIYCQIGKAIRMQTARQAFFEPDELAEEAGKVLSDIAGKGDYTDYLTIVPDGEPTLDIHLGTLVKKLKETGIPVAVISNASLIDRTGVQRDLAEADFVSLKIDAVTRTIWKKINKPHKSMDLDGILAGMLAFKDRYRGKLVTETMLIRDVNDSTDEIRKVASHVENLGPDTAYLAIPTRPPAFKNVKSATVKKVNEAFQIFSDRIPAVEYLTGYEGNAFASSGDPGGDVLSITAVHPMRDDAVHDLLDRSGADWQVVEDLVRQELLRKTRYKDHDFYLRKFKK